MPRPPHPSALRAAQRNRSATATLTGIWAILLTSALLGGFYLGRDVLVPLALAALITFLLSPLVGRLSRWIGNIAAVVVAMSLVLGATIGLGWSLGSQAIDFAKQVPSYKENIRVKLRSIQSSGEGTLSKLSETVEDLEKELPGNEGKSKAQRQVEPIRVTDDSGSLWERLGNVASPLLGPLGTASLVFLLSAFMLLKREDLRSRVVRLVGQGRISATTKALDDAGRRVRRYLLMQLVVNVTYGIPLAIGLYFIGVPNAVLWGALAAVLRFIPYIGPWIAALFPILLSLAVSPAWIMPLQTICLFVVLELISNNVLEPWLYGSSTGVSSIALIVSAVFWTWMWGPVGLVLSTPFTVCLVVMGRHIPQLSFLSVVLGEEEALTPAEDCYHRLLSAGDHDEAEFAESYLAEHSLVDLHDSVLVPVTIAAAEDHRTKAIDREQLNTIFEALGDLITEIGDRPGGSADAAAIEGPVGDYLVHFLSARAVRDDLAGAMAAQVLRERGIVAGVSRAREGTGEMIERLGSDAPELTCISVVSPSRAVHARNLLQRIRRELPDQKVVVGLWGRDDEDLERDIKLLRKCGADEVFTSIGELADHVTRAAQRLDSDTKSAPRPDDEDDRLRTLEELELVNGEAEPVLDHIAGKLARVFDTPIAAITLVDRDSQWFKAASGLPEKLAAEGSVERDLSVCAHVVAANGTVVARDLSRDRRFAGLPIVRDHGIRFYAGAPVRAANGKPLGALCVMDVSPRGFTPQERRMLEASAAEVAEEIQRMAGTAI